eukprot:TRINITY_DN8468_c0_g1_i1.p1 TRINITY_DN8468_c0_g1~~TRINITY_DN8468_c0_g1_i1.p1  ORF type:complete len:432 (+),score=86.02 TRINITY_DN8468_c0_g1_i1:225-1520(+)
MSSAEVGAYAEEQIVEGLSPQVTVRNTFLDFGFKKRDGQGRAQTAPPRGHDYGQWLSDPEAAAARDMLPAEAPAAYEKDTSPDDQLQGPARSTGDLWKWRQGSALDRLQQLLQESSNRKGDMDTPSEESSDRAPTADGVELPRLGLREPGMQVGPSPGLAGMMRSLAKASNEDFDPWQKGDQRQAGEHAGPPPELLRQRLLQEQMVMRQREQEALQQVLGSTKPARRQQGPHRPGSVDASGANFHGLASGWLSPTVPQPQLIHVGKKAEGDGYMIAWNVDARKLRGNDKQAVSPAFEVPLLYPSVEVATGIFKMMIYPKAVSDGKGGSSFKKARGRGIVQVKCESDLPFREAGRVRFRISVGNGRERPAQQHGHAWELRGPAEHDFSHNAVAGLPKEKEEWDFNAVTDQESLTFEVRLELQFVQSFQQQRP